MKQFYDINETKYLMLEHSEIRDKFLADLLLEKYLGVANFDRMVRNLNKLKNTNKMGKQTIYTVPEGVEVEKFEFDGNNFVVTVKDKDVLAPKDGDVCVGENSRGDKWIYIFKSKMKTECDNLHAILCNGELRFNDWCSFINRHRPTEAESAELFTAMEKAGYKWNAEAKRVEKIRWRAKKGEKYWFSNVDANRGETLYKPCETTENSGLFDNSMFKQGDYHKTKEDSQIYCNKLNEAIQNLNQWR